MSSMKIMVWAFTVGLSAKAMEEIIEIGLGRLRLEYIYWCVLPENIRAVKFYEKNGYQRVSPDELEIGGQYTCPDRYLWYWKKRDE